MVDAGGHLAGYWEEVLTVVTQARGVVCLVIHGGVRDTEAFARIRFPTFARGPAVFRTVKHAPGKLQISLVVGKVTICPGGVVVGDGDG